MAFRWKGGGPPAASPAELPAEPRDTGSPPGITQLPDSQPCASLAYALEKVLRRHPVQILEQGVLCGQSAVYLAERGARVFLDEWEPELEPEPPAGRESPLPPLPPLHLDHPDATFDLVLVWEMADFVSPARLPKWGAEMRRILKDGGWIVLFAHGKPESAVDSPPRYRVVSDDRVIREPSGRPPSRRWVHAARDLERALAGFSVQKVHLQRNQIREYVLIKERRAVPRVQRVEKSE